jgi:hypothetical protein
MNILPVGAELLRVDGRTDRNYKDNIRFPQFENAPTKKKGITLCISSKRQPIN